MLVLTPRILNLAERAVAALRRFLERRSPRRDLDEQRVEIRRDDRAAEAVAAVEAHGEAARRSIRRDAAVVGNEVAVRIFGRVTRHCIATPRHSIWSCVGMLHRRVVQLCVRPRSGSGCARGRCR